MGNLNVSFLLFAGNSNPKLVEKICDYLDVPLGKAKVETFSDGEIQIEIKENVRTKDVFVIQSTCSPVNNNLVEVLLIVDALRRSSAKSITVVFPYYGYARQDKKVAPRVPISAKLVANMITVAGASRVIGFEFHAGQIQGFFDIPADNLFMAPIIIPYLRNTFNNNMVIVSPDAGGVERARAFAKRLDADLAIIDKRRAAPNMAKAMSVVGEVKGKVAVILDDMTDTAGTLTEAAEAVHKAGAKEVHAACAHPVLSGAAVNRIKKSKYLKSLVVLDTIPLSESAEKCKKIIVRSAAKIIGDSIVCSYRGDSVNKLFL